LPQRSPHLPTRFFAIDEGGVTGADGRTTPAHFIQIGALYCRIRLTNKAREKPFDQQRAPRNR
jgi:hypothetical protein